MDYMEEVTKTGKKTVNLNATDTKTVKKEQEKLWELLESSQTGTGDILEKKNSIPVQCSKLDAQIKNGAASEAGKFGRSTTEEEKQQNRTDLLNKRDRLKLAHESFFAPGVTYTGKLTEALQTEKEQNAGTIRTHLTASVEPLMPRELLLSQQAVTPQFQVLSELFGQLQNTDAGAITRDQIQAMKVSYDALHLEQASVARKYLDEEHPDMAYLVLFHSVSMALFQQVNRMPKEAVNLEALAKLYGIATASSVAVGTACVLMTSGQQLDRQKAKEQQAEIIKNASQTQEKLNVEAHLAENKRYICEGIGKNGKKPAEWPMADYAEAVIRVIGEEQLKTLSLEEVALRTERMQEQLQSNVNLIGQLT